MKEQLKTSRIIALSLALFVAVGCGALKKQQPTVIIRDSIRTEYRDRIVRDTVNYEIPVEVEKVITRDTVSHLENRLAASDAVVSNGFLSHSLRTKAGAVVKVPVEVVVRDTVVVQKAAEIRTETQYVEKSLNWWQKFRLGAFWWLLVAGLAGWAILLAPKLIKRI